MIVFDSNQDSDRISVSSTNPKTDIHIGTIDLDEFVFLPCAGCTELSEQDLLDIAFKINKLKREHGIVY